MTFITVKYGDSKEELFNPNCRTFNLLKCIQQRCKCSDDVELSDESGHIKFLRDFPNKYASEMLSERESFVLLRVEKKESNGEIYIPLLNEEYVTDEFKARISAKGSGGSGSRPNSRSVRSNTRRPKKDDKSKRTEISRHSSLSSAKVDKRSKSRQGK